MIKPYKLLSLYERCKQLYEKARSIRAPWEEPVEEIIDFFRPDMVSFDTDFKDLSSVKFPGEDIYSSYPSWALSTMDRGFRGFTITRTLRWFKHKIGDKKLQGNDEVNKYLQDEVEYMYDVYRRSNLYDLIGSFTRQGISTGSPVIVYEEDEETGRMKGIVPHPKQRYLMHNFFGEPNGLIIEWDMAVKEAVDNFGYENLSISLQNLYDNGKHLSRERFLQFTLHHKDSIFKDAKEGEYKPERRWPSFFIQESTDKNKEKPLFLIRNGIERKGYHHRNFTTWHYNKEFPYDYSFTPAWYARFDAKSLMQIVKHLLMAAQKQISPAWYLPAFMKDTFSFYPNAFNFYENLDQANMIPKPLQQNINFPIGKEQQFDVIENIKRWFYVDFFMLLSSLVDKLSSQPTATQIIGMLNEKAILLGPTVETYETFLADTDNIFVSNEIESGRHPEPPDIIYYESRGELIPEFIGPLHQMQAEYHNRRRSEVAINAIAPYLQEWPETKFVIKAEDAVEHILEESDFWQDSIRSKEERDEIKQAMIQKLEQQENMNVLERGIKSIPSLQKETAPTSPAAQLIGAA